jgi:hypothetical protein
MDSNNIINEEVLRMKSLFGYQRGRVISEQTMPSIAAPQPVVPPLPASPVAAATPAVPIPQALPTPETPRQQNINNAFCSVKGGIIVNPYSQAYNNKPWTGYTTENKVTDAEIQVAKQKCPTSELAVAAAPAAAPVAAVNGRTPDPKVMELQQQLKDAGYGKYLGTTGKNHDGVDGIMGRRTRNAQRLMIQQKGQDALKDMTKQGQDLQNKWKQTGQMTPEQIANANALKAGQPLPPQTTQTPTAQTPTTTPVPAAPVARNEQ